MARTAEVTEEVVQAAYEVAQEAKTGREMHMGLSVLIPKECGVGNEVAARTLNVSVATVLRMQRRIRDQVDGKEGDKGNWGGRQRETMSVQEEQEFLKPWVDKAEAGGVLVCHPFMPRSRMGGENLDETRAESQQIQQGVKLNEPLAAAYCMKKDLREVWIQPNKKIAEGFFIDWLFLAGSSGIPC